MALLLLDSGARSRVAADDAGEGTLPRRGPFPRARAAADERSRTLDDLLSGTWESLAAAASSTACPVCAGDLQPRWSAGAGVVGGRCRDCGSELS
jgi:hypothetical protein